MTNFSKQITISSPQEKVWKTMSNLGGIYKFNPSVKTSYYISDKKEGIGAARICELYTGKVEETASEWEDGKSFVLKIKFLEKAPPLKNVTARVDISAIDATTTEAKVTIEYATKMGIIGKTMNGLLIKSQLEKAIQQLLQGLKLNVEKGVEIKNSKALKELLNAA